MLKFYIFAAILCVIYIYVIFSLISSVNVISGIIHEERMLFKSGRSGVILPYYAITVLYIIRYYESFIFSLLVVDLKNMFKSGALMLTQFLDLLVCFTFLFLYSMR